MNWLHPFAELDALRRNCVRLWEMDAYIIRKQLFVDYITAYEASPAAVRWIHGKLNDIPHPGWSTADRTIWHEVLAWGWINLTDQGKDRPTIRVVELPDELPEKSWDDQQPG